MTGSMQMYLQVGLVISALSLVSCVCSTSGSSDSLFTGVDYTLYSGGDTTCKQVKHDPNCHYHKDSISSNCSQTPVLDALGCCYVCPRLEREVCGGYLYKNGRCAVEHICLHKYISEKEFKKRLMIEKRVETGKCIYSGRNRRKACFTPNCCKKAWKPKCGTDGKWYYNQCALSKENCFRPIGAPEIRKCSKGKCGEQPKTWTCTEPPSTPGPDPIDPTTTTLTMEPTPCIEESST